MRSSDLTSKQIQRLRVAIKKQHSYYMKLWSRLQANSVPFEDPLSYACCKISEELQNGLAMLDRLERQLPKLVRPGQKPFRNSGLSTRAEPWAQQQRDAAAAVEAEKIKPTPPEAVKDSPD